jgi:hypothetical protein
MYSLDDKDRLELIEHAEKIDPEAMASEASAARPGRYEGADDLALVVALDILTGVGGEDESAGNVEFADGHAARFGRFILWTDNYGFKTAESFESVAAAESRVAEVNSDDEL